MEIAAELAGRGLAPRTVTRYRYLITTALRWCAVEGVELEQITAPELARYGETLPLTFASRTALRAALGHFFDLVGRESPPLRAIRTPKAPEPYCRALEPDEVHRLAKAARNRGDDKGLAVCFGLYAGMRRTEIAECEWAWFREPTWVHILGKGAKTRRVPLHPLLDLLLEGKERVGPRVFVGYKGTALSPATVWLWCREVCRDAGVPESPPHVLRHCCLATGNDNTSDLRSVQAFAGHAKIETTVRYTRATTRKLRAVVNSLDY